MRVGEDERNNSEVKWKKEMRNRKKKRKEGNERKRMPNQH